MPKRCGILKRLKELSPAAKREIIVIIIILIISVALSIPQYIKDRKAADRQKNDQGMNIEVQSGIGMTGGKIEIQLHYNAED
jgi:hypothetical protein